MYTYDGEGRRVKKVSAAETTIFVYDASGVLIAEYSGEVASEPRVSYLTTDHLGSPRVTTNERGAVVNRRDFMAFGEEAKFGLRRAECGVSLNLDVELLFGLALWQCGRARPTVDAKIS